MTNSSLSRTQWAIGICIISLLTVIVLTLAPFNFAFEEDQSFLEIIGKFRHRSSLDDWIANLLLYVPLGFSLAAWLQTRKISKLFQLVCIILVAFSLSTAVEILQLFLPSRIPSSTDIYANTVGSILGMQCFNYLGYTIVSDIVSSVQTYIRRTVDLPIQNLSLILLGYLLFIFSVSVGLQAVINLSNWTPVYPLLVGNDEAIGISWHGNISKLSVADQAASEEDVKQIFAEESLVNPLSNSVVASYALTSYQNGYPDITGNSPKLVWRGITTPKDNITSSVNANHWLETEAPASFINQRLSQTSQFTLSVILATDDVKQTQSVPIVSLSNQSTDRRNLALAQDGENLIFWLRTSVTGEKGTRPELVIPDVFTDANPHHLIITYDRSTLRFYVDQLENQISFELNPGLVLFQKLLPLEQLKNSSLIACKALYYGVFFVPLGIFIGTIFALTRRGIAYRTALITESVLLIPIALEVLLSFKAGRDFNLASLLLSMAITIMTIVGVSLLVRSSSPTKKQTVHLIQ